MLAFSRDVSPTLACLALLLALGCSSAGDEPSCDLEGCGEHGRCEQGRCECDPGWQPSADGLACVPFSHDPCEGVTCSGLGTCAIELVGPYLIPKPACQCVEGAVRTVDLLDCVQPCAGVDCGPGSCEVNEQARAYCVCPGGHEPTDDGLGCQERSSFFYQLIYEEGGEQYSFGYAQLSYRYHEQDKLLSVDASYSIPISERGGMGGRFRVLARHDSTGELVEYVLDHQPEFHAFSPRRRLHFSVEPDGGAGRLRFESNIQDRIWHGELELERPLLPVADATEYPAFTYSLFDPYFYFRLIDFVDPDAPGEQYVDVLYANFVMPGLLRVIVSGDAQALTVELPDYALQAEYADGILTAVRFGWIDWRLLDEGSGLEVNLTPLPTTPAVHQVPEPAERVAEEVRFDSADGTQLAGSLTLPAEGEPEACALLFAPGLMPSSRDQGVYYNRTATELAARLAEAGYASLRFDDRGVGESQGQTNAPPERLAEDIEAAHAWLMGDARFERVVLLAHGFATPRALLAAAELELCGLVLIAPTGDDLAHDLYNRLIRVMELADFPHRMVEDWYRSWEQELDGYKTGERQDDFYGRAAAYWYDMLNRDFFDCSRILSPVLLMRGDEDLVLPAENLEALAASLSAEGREPSTLRFQGLSHTLTPGREAELWERIHLPDAIDPLAIAGLVSWLHAIAPDGE
ncbi:MAG: alpha/beta hydrolase [Deltaproteobacteria bacterium]|nr:alpha/beta hydrolase [Deltaproteobacteria bacterium]